MGGDGAGGGEGEGRGASWHSPPWLLDTNRHADQLAAGQLSSFLNRGWLTTLFCWRYEM